MNTRTVTGVGCFAGPEKLSRTFLKWVQNYTLGGFEGIESAGDSEAGQAEGIQLLKALIAGKSAGYVSLDSDGGKVLETRKITGFFLTLTDQKLKLSIFAEAGGNRQERHSAVLDALTAVRRRRLN